MGRNNLAGSVCSLNDELGSVYERGGPVAEWCERLLGVRYELSRSRPGALQTEEIDIGRLAGASVLLGGLAKRACRRFHIEDIIGDLEGEADIIGIAAKRGAIPACGSAENGPRSTCILEECAGLHRLHVHEIFKPWFRTLARAQIKHLAASHAILAGRLGEAGDELDAHRGIGMGLRLGQEGEGKSLEGIAGEDRGCFIESLVNRRLPTS